MKFKKETIRKGGEKMDQPGTGNRKLTPEEQEIILEKLGHIGRDELSARVFEEKIKKQAQAIDTKILMQFLGQTNRLLDDAIVAAREICLRELSERDDNDEINKVLFGVAIADERPSVRETAWRFLIKNRKEKLDKMVDEYLTI